MKTIISIIFVLMFLAILGLNQYKNGRRLYNNRPFMIAAVPFAVMVTLFFFNENSESVMNLIQKMAADAVTVSANAIWAELLLVFLGSMVVISGLTAIFFYFGLFTSYMGRRCQKRG